jgi:hypothetical protein
MIAGTILNIVDGATHADARGMDPSLVDSAVFEQLLSLLSRLLGCKDQHVFIDFVSALAVSLACLSLGPKDHIDAIIASGVIPKVAI